MFTLLKMEKLLFKTGQKPPTQGDDEEKAIIAHIINDLQISGEINDFVFVEVSTDNLPRFRSAFERYKSSYNKKAGSNKDFTFKGNKIWRVK